MIDLSTHAIQGDKWLYDVLSEQKTEVFSDEFRLNFLYTSDEFNNRQSVGKTLMRLQEYLAILDIPNFFVVVHTNKQDIQQDLVETHRIFSPTDVVISHKFIDGTFNKIIKKYKSFCILPWLNLHVNAQGLVAPCCQFDENYPIANLADTNIKDVVNNDHLKLVRKQMLNDERPTVCNNCWKQEDIGINSMRNEVNSAYGDYSHLIAQTSESGEFDFKLESIDFRASNVCNMRCRMCSGKYSSRIAQEEIILYPSIQKNENFVENKLNNTQITEVLSFISSQLNNLKRIYFAGGEPLLMEEHYKILDLFLENNKSDIDIEYNTNLSILKYKNISVIDYWKKFKKISLNASLDLIDEKANYVREGADYRDIEKNFLLLPDNVNFFVDSTYTIYNVFDLPNLQKRWITKFNLSPRAFKIRLSLLPPEIMSCRILPDCYKKQASDLINEHIKWLLTIKDSEKLVDRWRVVLNFMNSADCSHLLPTFFKLNDDKDRHRKEVFEEVFPEYKNLRSYV